MADAGKTTVLTKEIRSLIGIESEPLSWPVERGAILKVLRALQDNSPLWKELEVSGTGATVPVPPAYFMSVRAPEMRNVKIDVPLHRMVAGGEEWQFLAPLRLKLGSNITVKRKIKDILEKQGSKGPMLLTICEDSFRVDQAVLALRRVTQIRL